MGHLEDEHYRGAIGDQRAYQRSGLETLRRYVRGELPLPPIARLAGFRPTEAGLGKATFTMPVTRWLEDGFGLYWGGVFALFADAPLMSALWTTVPARKSVSTSELHMSFVRPMSRKTSNMIGRAETVHSGSQVGLSMIQITDNEGRLLAFGNTRCLITDVPVDLDVEYPPPDLGPTEPADPYLRSPPEDGYFSLDQITNGDPVELMRQTTRGEKIPPVWRLAGYRLGRASFVRDVYPRKSLRRPRAPRPRCSRLRSNLRCATTRQPRGRTPGGVGDRLASGISGEAMERRAVEGRLLLPVRTAGGRGFELLPAQSGGGRTTGGGRPVRFPGRGLRTHIHARGGGVRDG